MITSSYRSSEVVRGDDDNPDTIKYYVKLRYSYIVDNKDVEGDAINLSSDIYNDELDAKMASSAPCAVPTIWAPIPIRPSFSVSIATLYPLPTSPSTLALGTFTAHLDPRRN